jgi:hypothetical protein
MKKYGIEMLGPFIGERVDSLPVWSPEDTGRFVYNNSDNKLYVGDADSWEEISFGESSSGYSGYSGYSGLSGFSGFSGLTGSGTSGYSGINGNSGFSGFSGYSGTPGINGESGYSGYSGIEGLGYSGISGFSGYSGFSGSYPTIPINSQPDSYTLTLSDSGGIVDINKATSVTLIIPKNSDVNFPVGSNVTIRQGGAGTVTITPYDGTVVINNKDGLVMTGQYAIAGLIKMDTDTWTAFGALRS